MLIIIGKYTAMSIIILKYNEQGGRGEDSGVESAHSLGGTRGEF